MATYPFVNFKMWPTQNINSSPQLIFGNDQYTCCIDGIFLANVTDNQILITLQIARELTPGVDTNFIFNNQISLSANATFDALTNTSIILQTGDILYASSDFSGNIFNSFVSYREFTELTITPMRSNFNKRGQVCLSA